MKFLSRSSTTCLCRSILPMNVVHGFGQCPCFFFDTIKRIVVRCREYWDAGILKKLSSTFLTRFIYCTMLHPIFVYLLLFFLFISFSSLELLFIHFHLSFTVIFLYFWLLRIFWIWYNISEFINWLYLISDMLCFFFFIMCVIKCCSCTEII